jgi:pantothenate kinase
MDLFAYATQSEGEIEYQLITTDEYEMSNAVIEERKAVIKSVKGKMTLP